MDGKTGLPAQGKVVYYPHLLNPLVGELDQLKDRMADGYNHRYITRPDGSFRLVGLPGKGLVGVGSVRVLSRRRGVRSVLGPQRIRAS